MGGSGLNLNDSRKSNVADWSSIDLAMIAVIAFGIVGILLMIALIPLKAHAKACLSIEVPPQAVIDQYDGDTFTIFSFSPGGQVKIRVQDIDTPERNKKEPGWEAARDFTAHWLSVGIFTVSTCGKPTLDRIVGIVSRNGETLGDALRKAGHEKQK